MSHWRLALPVPATPRALTSTPAGLTPHAKMRQTKSALPISIVLLLAGAGCTPEYENPFAGRTRTVVPPPSATLLFTTSQWATEPGSGREVFSVDADGANLTRLTYCNTASSICDNLDAEPSPDRGRILARRILGSDAAPTVVYV